MTSAYTFESLFGRLVEYDTTSWRSNVEVVDWLAGVLEAAGLRVDRHLSPDQDKANLIALLAPVRPHHERSGLTLCGHLDVVPADESGWLSDPFRLTDTGDRWVGRGTADMKGFIALACALALELDPATLRAPLALLFTYDEEVGSRGARHLAARLGEAEPPAWAPLPAATVIGEPTRLAAIRLHKGHLQLHLAFRGQAAHSAYPRHGSSAIEPAGRAIVALEALRRELEGERGEQSEHFPEVPFPTLNVARVVGGGAVNVIPDACFLDIGVRLLPGMEADPFVERIRAAVSAAVEAPFELDRVHFSPPLLTPETAPIYRSLRELLGQRETISASYSSDAGFLSRAGFDCVLWGPGDIATAHRANESLPKADVETAKRLLETLVARFCQSENSDDR